MRALAAVVPLGVLLGALLLPAASPASEPPKSAAACDQACSDAAFEKSVQAARNGQYMEASFGLLANLGVDAPEKIRDPDVFDQWSQVWSAMTGAPADNAGKTAYRHVSKDEIAAIESAEARPAIAEIVARARNTRVVILDEDHLTPQDRAFGLEVARALRPLGYTMLAVEGLTRDRDDAVSLEKMRKLSADGYVRRASGYYLNDPVFADYLRQAMAMGYRLVSYESAGFTDEKTEEAATARREQEEAENIARRALASDPNAKVLVYSGFHHAAKTAIIDIDPKITERRWMALRLKELTGIDPLVIDQAEYAQALYRPDVDIDPIAARKAKGQSIVLFSHDKPLVVGLLAGAVDLQVVHPRLPPKYGRPGWLAHLGRRPVAIPADLLPQHGTRLIQAFLANEADDAIPIDQVLVTAGRPVPKLMLPNARVRYAYQEAPSRAP
jgi:hypothetical protein